MRKPPRGAVFLLYEADLLEGGEGSVLLDGAEAFD